MNSEDIQSSSAPASRLSQQRQAIHLTLSHLATGPAADYNYMPTTSMADEVIADNEDDLMRKERNLILEEEEDDTYVDLGDIDENEVLSGPIIEQGLRPASTSQNDDDVADEAENFG